MRISPQTTSRGTGIIGKLIFSAFGLFFAFMGSMFVRQELEALKETKAMQQWIQTPCEITSSDVQDAGEDFKLALSYSYSFDGRDYTATRYSRAQTLTAETITEINQAQKRLSPGTQSICHVNPDHPAEAVFKRPTVKSATRAIGFTLLFPAFGLFFAVIPWLRGRSKPTVAAPTSTHLKAGKYGLVLFGAVFLLVGLSVTYHIGIKPILKSRDAKTWNTVPATVVSSKVKSHTSRSDGHDRTTYSVYIAYRYEINDEEFVGDQYSFTGGSSSGRAGKQNIVNQYPTGRTFDLFVNSANPEESVIVRNLGNRIFAGFIPLVFVFAGIGIMSIPFCRSRRARLNMQQAAQHTIALKGPSPVGKAIGISLFAILWTGVVVVLIKSNSGLLFPVVFGLVDIGILCGVVYHILAIFNPRPAAEISPGNIRPGTGVSLRWDINGNTARISKLTVTLQCRKVTTQTTGSGKGRSTKVVKTPLYTDELIATDNDFEIQRGTASFTIPDNRPVSRPGNSSGIEWLLLFHGDIARWPDLKQELPFIVYPEQGS